MIRATVVVGGLAAMSLALLFGGASALGWRMYRDATGEDEASAVTERVVRAVVAKHAATGRLCGSSLLEHPDPLAYHTASELDGDDRRLVRLRAREEAEGVGFHCLGLRAEALSESRFGVTYTRDGDQFVVRAFRVYLFDPDGVLPRWERRGQVRDGTLVVDPRLYPVAPGGRRFAGHPQPYGADEADVD